MDPDGSRGERLSGGVDLKLRVPGLRDVRLVRDAGELVAPALDEDRAAMAAAKATTNLVGQVEDESIHSSIGVPIGVVLFLFSVGALPVRALRAGTSALL